MAFSKRLGPLHKERGLTQQDLADLGVHLTQIQRCDSDTTQPNRHNETSHKT